MVLVQCRANVNFVPNFVALCWSNQFVRSCNGLYREVLEQILVIWFKEAGYSSRRATFSPPALHIAKKSVCS